MNSRYLQYGHTVWKESTEDSLSHQITKDLPILEIIFRQQTMFPPNAANMKRCILII